MSKFLVPVLFTLLPCLAAAGSLPDTLDEALAYALEHREEVRIKRKFQDLAQFRVEEKRAAFLPRLDLASTVQRSKYFDTFSGVTIEGELNQLPIRVAIERDLPRYQQNTSVILSYDLYDSGFNRWQLNEAEARARAAAASTREAMRSVALELAQAYVNVAKLQIEHSGAARALELQTAVEKISRTSYAAGQSARIDMESAVLARREKAAELEQVSHRLEEAWTRYASTLGAVRPAGARCGPRLKPFEPVSIKSLHAIAAPAPELDRLHSEAQAIAARARASAASESARVELFAQYAFVGRDDSRLGSALGDFQSDYAAVGVKLRANLFDAGKRPRRQQRLIENEIAQLELARQSRVLNSAHAENSQQLQQAEARYEIAEEREQLARAKVEIEQVRWRSGEASALRFSEATNARDAAQDQLRLREFDRALAALKWALFPLVAEPALESAHSNSLSPVRR